VEAGKTGPALVPGADSSMIEPSWMAGGFQESVDRTAHGAPSTWLLAGLRHETEPVRRAG